MMKCSLMLCVLCLALQAPVAAVDFFPSADSTSEAPSNQRFRFGRDRRVQHQVLIVVQDTAPAPAHPAAAPTAAHPVAAPPARPAAAGSGAGLSAERLAYGWRIAWQLASDLPPAQREAFADEYAPVFGHPLQYQVMGDLGPTPLFIDVVSDGNGGLKPRLPDPYTYLTMVAPGRTSTGLTITNNLARLQRVRQAEDLRVPVAEDLGIVTDKHYEKPRARDPETLSVADMSQVHPDSRGESIYSPEQARKLGLKQEEIPRTPRRGNPLEVLWVWDDRCEYCTNRAVFSPWAKFGADVAAAGYKAMGINLHNEPYKMAAKIKRMTRSEPAMGFVKNVPDITNIRESMQITRTPTYIFINRMTGKVVRHVGPMTEQALRTAFVGIAGWPTGTWPPPAIPAGWLDAHRATLPSSSPAAPAIASPFVNHQTQLNAPGGPQSTTNPLTEGASP